MKPYKEVLSRFVAADFRNAIGATPSDAEASFRQDLQAVMKLTPNIFQFLHWAL